MLISVFSSLDPFFSVSLFDSDSPSLPEIAFGFSCVANSTIPLSQTEWYRELEDAY